MYLAPSLYSLNALCLIVKIIKFTTCLAVKVLNAWSFTFLSPSLQDSLLCSTRNMLHKISCYISDICHCITATQTDLILPGRLPSTLPLPMLWALYSHSYFLGHRPIHFRNSLTVHLVLYVFPERFTFYKKSSRTPLLSWHFLFLTSVNDDEDDDNSNNTAAAGANIWELTMGVALINILFNSQTHDVYTLL